MSSAIRNAADHVSLALAGLGDAADRLQEVEEHTATNRAAALHELLSEYHDELEQLIQGRGPLCKPDQESGCGP